MIGRLWNKKKAKFCARKFSKLSRSNDIFVFFWKKGSALKFQIIYSARCNTAVDCNDKSDEYGCSYLRIGNDYSKTSIPRATGGGPLIIHMNVSVLAFPNIDSFHLKFTADFFLNLRWHDNRIAFRDLNKASLLNSLGAEDMMKVWTPHLVFFNALGPYTTVVDSKTNMRLLMEDEPLLEDMTQSVEGNSR